MSRRWYTYLFAFCVALWCSCTEPDVYVDGNAETDARVLPPICFTNSYVDNAVTRNSNALSEHQISMGVWGWRIDDTSTEEEIFSNQYVSYNPDSTIWSYNPLRYWDKDSRYAFYAYAPHQSNSMANVSIDAVSKHLAMRNVTLHGHNLQAEPTYTVKKLFVNTPDIDWMVARGGQVATGKSVMEVEFTMQHILAKFNINVKADTALLSRISSLSVDSIVVGKLIAQADFVQQLNHTPLLATPEETDVVEWTNHSASTLYIRGLQSCEITEEPIYLIESLVIPQQISDDVAITLYYTYRQEDGHVEECRYRLPLNKVVDYFVSGYDHTLTLVLGVHGVVAEKGISKYED